MVHKNKISDLQFGQLPVYDGNSIYWHAAGRLREGKGTDVDLGQIVRLCIEHGQPDLACELREIATSSH